VPSLLDAAKRLGSLDPERARDAHLEALYAASVAGRLGGGMRDAAHAARAAPAPPATPRAVDLLLDGLAVRYTDGYSASAPALKRAVAALQSADGEYEEDLHWPWLGARVAADLFDDDSFRLLASRRAQFIRDAGALAMLPLVLTYVADLRVFEGRLDAAAALTAEAESIIDATGGRRVFSSKLLLGACRGDAEAAELIAQVERDAAARGEGAVLTFAEHARAVLGNGRGDYEAARAAAQRASDQDELGVSTWSLAELVEAAARAGEPDAASGALRRLRERTGVVGTDWARGVELRSRALVSDGEAAEPLYREAVERLGRSRLAFELARAHLLYGEWLRREKRRTEARDQLRRAHEMFREMGAGPFAERCHREIAATGETARKRTAETRDELTPQEVRIARLARDGASNQEIATQLFVSPKTVEYHLHKVFRKLRISTRAHLDRVLIGD
jgi:DNA-binding CsgD family transcriptional regulator